MNWIELGLALTLFFASHRIPAALGVKARLVGLLGARGYGLAFSVVSLALLGWLIVAAGRAPFVPLWDQAQWHRWAVNLTMPLVIALGVYGVGAPNPFAFEGRTQGFDPARPGIAGLTRQPLLWALALWSAVHLLANGDLAHVLIFAPFLVLALAGMPMVEARRRGPDWAHLTARTALIPGLALATGRWRPQALPSLPRAALGLGLWAAIWHLHAPVIGVWPGP